MLITPILFFLVQKVKLLDFSQPIGNPSSDYEDETKIIDLINILINISSNEIKIHKSCKLKKELLHLINYHLDHPFESYGLV